MAKALVIKGADFETNRVAVIEFEGAHTTAVSVSPQTATLNAVGATQALTCTVTPSDSVDPVIWTSSDSSVATVANGVVTATGIGTCTITATSGSFSATCSIAVEVFLSGVKTPRTLTEANSSGNNCFTKMTCNVGYAQTNYDQYLTMTDASQTVPTELMCASMAKNVAESGYDFEIIQPGEFTANSNQERIYNAIGYPLPMKLPAGCTKIKCIALSAQYAAYPLFFDSTTRALNTAQDVNGAQYYNAFRQKYTPKADDYTWVYEAESEYNVPSGYDSVVVSWQSDPEDATAVKPVDMTAEQIAEFKVQCL